MRYLKKGESVSVLEETNSYWLQVRDASGQIGYISSSSKYVNLTAGPTEVADAPAPVNAANAVIVAGVSFRTAPSTSGERMRYLQKDELVTVTSQVNDYWYAVTDANGQTGYVSTSSKYIKLTGGIAASEGGGSTLESGGSSSEGSSSSEAADAPAPVNAANAVIVAGVSFRTAPSTSGERMRYLQKDELVTVTSQVNSYWYAVTDASGQSGYVSTSSQYIRLTGDIPAPAGGGSGSELSSTPSSAPGSSGNAEAPAGSDEPARPSASAQVESVIEAGMKYLGTPYEYGSSRSTTTTFDCSDFVRQAFKDALGVTLPADSASQGEYVLDKSQVTTDWKQLKRGDLIFFMSYKGTSASLYQSKDPFNTRISHVGIYLGDGQVLHTYSNESGGVRVNSIQGRHWEYRFLYGGSAL
ncbi:C40 family peptidase [Cohnella lubricantis]|uniref:C40 family peptidase n=2 Tax=Cohnella lubricantis TaxID=2163172 RepID=A0A841T9E1_9BACL|nr:C40 family peptidase [Cohnella lubricantis]